MKSKPGFSFLIFRREPVPAPLEERGQRIAHRH